ncbi:isocitrate lyase/PEP mutase family protein [Bosea sp. F3-2]|uniref:isocitrate lyase/PEP mutase family protein n=1 Tax=Bosea sp. F3-2 TaxID=2599640 RepID=UPI0020BD6628|nr:isocitrate lyase/PEP mutase family protein [Bosea sp. F3-2]
MNLRERLRRPGIVVAPGCHDALGARIIERAGFEAIYMTGNGLSASILGAPDLGLLTLTEMAARARAIAASIAVPLIADADTGYGNLNNVARTIAEYEMAGVGALHLEDQVTPKKCGAMSGLSLVSADEHAEKIRCAVKARRNPDMLIIGRTDARLVLGLDEAIARGKAYAEAGADLVLIEMLQSEDEMRQAVRSIDAPMMFNSVDGRTPPLTASAFESIGFKLLAFPLSATLAYARLMEAFAADLKASGSTNGWTDRMTSIHDYEHILGLERYA